MVDIFEEFETEQTRAQDTPDIFAEFEQEAQAEQVPTREEIQEMPDILEEMGLAPRFQEVEERPSTGSSYFDIAKSTAKTFLPAVASAGIKFARGAGETIARATGITEEDAIIPALRPKKPQEVVEIEAQLREEGRDVPETIARGISEKASDFLDEYVAREKDLLDLDTADKRLLNDILSTTANMVPYIVGGIVTSNPQLALGGMSAQVVGEKYGEIEDDPRFTQGQKAGIALGHGAITYMTEKLPMEFLFKRFGKGFVNNSLGYLLREVPSEIAEGVLQDAVDIATVNPELTGEEVIDRAVATILPTIGSSILLVGAGSGLTRFADRVSSRETGEVTDKQSAEQTNIGDIIEAVERDPENVVPSLTDEEQMAIDALQKAEAERVATPIEEETAPEPIAEEPTITEQIEPAPREQILTEEQAQEFAEFGEELTPQEEELSGIAKTLIPEETAREFPEQRTTLQAELDKGEKLVKNNTINPQILMDEIIKSPRALQPNETAALVYYKRTLDNDFNKAFDLLEEAKATGDRVAQDEIQQRIDVINELKNKFFEVSDTTGYQQGLSLGLRAMMLDSEYNLRTKINEYKASNNGVIEPEVEARFRQYDNELQQAKKQIRDLEKQLSAREEEQIIEGIRRDAEKLQKEDRVKGRDLIAEGVDELITALGGKTSFAGEVSPKVSKALAKIGRGLIDEGIATIDNVVDKIKQYLAENDIPVKDIENYQEAIVEDINSGAKITTDKEGNIQIPNQLIRDYVRQGVETIDELVTSIKGDFNLNIEDRVLRDQISGYGRQISLSQDDISKKIREFKRTGRVISSIEDVVAKKKPLKSGVKKDELTADENRLRERLRELLKELPEVQAERLDRIKSNIKKQTEEYERRLKEKDFVVREKTTVPFEEEMSRLQIARDRVKKQYDIEIEKVKRNNRSRKDKLKELYLDVFNLPKALMASADFSAPLRQGAVLGFNNPKEAFSAGKEMFRQAFSQERYNDYLDRVKQTPEYGKMVSSGLFIGEPTTKLEAREEDFMTNLAEKIPVWGKVVQGSERAYTGYLNKLRIDVFNKYSQELEDQGYTMEQNPEVFKSMADFINNATGRGGLGGFEGSAPFLNTMLFSPRYVTSRLALMNPVKYAQMPKPVRKIALRNMISFLGVGGSIITLAALGGADVEEDPRSSDFGKIKVGNTRFDIWAGFQQPIRTIAQLLSGQTKGTQSGIIRDLDPKKFPFSSRGDLLARFLRGKLSPSASLITDVLQGETFMGEELTPMNTLVERAIPLYLQDMGDILKEEGIVTTGAAGILSLFGVGVQHFKSKNQVKNNIEKGLSLKDTISAIEAEEGEEFSKRKKNNIGKRYRAYEKYGLENNDLDYLLSSGFTNEEKANYLVKTGLDRKEVLSFLRNKVISKALYKKYKTLKKEQGV